MGKPLVKHNPLPRNRRANFPPGRRIGAIYCPQTTTTPQNKKLDFRFIPINPVFFAVRRFFKNFRGGVDVCKLPLRRPNFRISLPRFGQKPKKWNRGSSFNKHNVSRRFRSCPTALKHALLTPKPPDFRRLFLWLLRLLPLSVHSSITSITMLPSSCGIIL